MDGYLKNVGRLAEKKQKAEELEIKIKGLVQSLHDHADPFEDIETLDTDIIASQAMELARTRIEYMGLQSEIAALKKALGRG